MPCSRRPSTQSTYHIANVVYRVASFPILIVCIWKISS